MSKKSRFNKVNSGWQVECKKVSPSNKEMLPGFRNISGGKISFSTEGQQERLSKGDFVCLKLSGAEDDILIFGKVFGVGPENFVEVEIWWSGWESTKLQKILSEFISERFLFNDRQ